MGLGRELVAFEAEFAPAVPMAPRASFGLKIHEAKIEGLSASFGREDVIGLNARAPDLDLPGDGGGGVLRRTAGGPPNCPA